MLQWQGLNHGPRILDKIMLQLSVLAVTFPNNNKKITTWPYPYRVFHRFQTTPPCRVKRQKNTRETVGFGPSAGSYGGGGGTARVPLSSSSCSTLARTGTFEPATVLQIFAWFWNTRNYFYEFEQMLLHRESLIVVVLPVGVSRR